MSIRDLCAVIGHYWRIMLGFPLACVAIALACSFFLFPRSYSASAVLEASDPSGNLSASSLRATVSPLADQAVAAQGPAVTVSEETKSGSDIKSFGFVATGSNPVECVELANAAANATAESAASLFGKMSEALADDFEREIDIKVRALEAIGDSEAITSLLNMDTVHDRRYEYVTFSVQEATEAYPSATPLKGAVLGLVIGVVLAFVWVLALWYIRAPIVNRKEIEELGITALAFPGLGGDPDYLWANVQFVCGTPPSSVAVIPLRGCDPLVTAGQIEAAAKRDGFSATISFAQERRNSCAIEPDSLDLIVCSLLDENVSAALAARSAEATVIVACAWVTSAHELETVLQELKIADAKIAGVALLPFPSKGNRVAARRR